MKKLLLAAMLLLTALPYVAQAQNSWTNTFSIEIFKRSIPVISTNSLAVTVTEGNTTNVSITVSNAGNVALDFNLSSDGVEEVFRGYSYHWENNIADWVEIFDFDSPGNHFSEWQTDDDGPVSSTSIPIGFKFPFYYDGNTYKFFSAGMHGGLTMGGFFANPLPSSSNGEFTYYQAITDLDKPSAAYGHYLHSNSPLIAPLWSKYSVDTSKVLFSTNRQDQLVVTWNDVDQCNGESGLSFQAQLNANGSIAFLYRNINTAAFTNAATGIQAIQTSGIQLIGETVEVIPEDFPVPFEEFEPPENASASSYTFYIDADGGPWITGESGRLEGGESQTLQIKINTEGHSSGASSETLAMINSDGSTNSIVVDVTIDPLSTSLDVPNSVNFQAVEGDKVSTNVLFTNTGDTDIDYTITDISGQANSFSTPWKRTAYNWVDVTSLSDYSEVTLVKPGESIFTEPPSISELLPIGFSFPYFGGFYTNFSIGRNGGISLGEKHSMRLYSQWQGFNTKRSDDYFRLQWKGYLSYDLGTIDGTYINTGNRYYYTSDPMTHDPVPQEFLAPYWSELGLSSDSKIYIGYDDQRTIITWENMLQSIRFPIPDIYDVDRDNNYTEIVGWDVYEGSGNTFQALLYPDGRIIYQYKRLNGSDLWVDHTEIGLRNTPTLVKRAALDDAAFTVAIDLDDSSWDGTLDGLISRLADPNESFETNTTFIVSYPQVVTNGYLEVDGNVFDVPVLETNTVMKTLHKENAEKVAVLFDPRPASGGTISIDTVSGSLAPGETDTLMLTGDARSLTNGVSLSKTYSVKSQAPTATMTVTLTVIAMPSPDQLADTDKDGLADTMERRLGSDPLDPDSTYTTHVNGSRTITWTPASDGDSRTYRVQYRTSLTSGKWEDLATVTNETAYTDTLNTEEPMVFYRVVLVEWK